MEQLKGTVAVKILDAIRSKPNGPELANRLHSEVRAHALSKLEHSRDLFPHFTDHTIRHSDGVLAILDWLVPDDVKVMLNEWELYFLVAATYLHDLGMVLGCPGAPSGADWEQFLTAYKARRESEGLSDQELTRAATQDFVRDTHHLRSEQYIRDNRVELGLRASDTPAEASIAARISLGHRRVDLSDRAMFSPTPFGNNQLIHRDLLAAYLRLADELDTTAFRTPMAEYQVLGQLDEESALEWAKHLSISGVWEDQGLLVIGGECHHHSIYLRLRKLHADLRTKLAEVKRMLPRPYATSEDFYLPDPIPYHDVDLRIEHIGYLPIEIKFDLQDREITNLIMGERLYGDKTACIRELLQNSVDTCREAAERRPGNWQPEIRVTESPDGTTFTVSDNGMGMDEDIVRQYFSRVGISYYRSPEFQGRFRPISEFGIGFLSCFMLADKLLVESKRDGSSAIRLEIESGTQPFIPSRGSRTTPGTDVILYLKPEAQRKNDFLERVRHFAQLVEFPIDVVTRDGKRENAVRTDLRPSAAEINALVDEFWRADGDLTPIEKRIPKFSRFVDHDGLKLAVALPDQLFGRQRRPFKQEPTLFHVYQDGFFVGHFPEEFRKFAGFTWCMVNLTGAARFKLTADRTRLSSESRDVWAAIANAYSEAVEAIYYNGETEQQNWWQYHGRYYSFWLATAPLGLVKSAEEHSRICSFSSSGFQSVSLEEAKSNAESKYLLAAGDHRHIQRFSLLFREGLEVVFKPDVHGKWVDSIIESERYLGPRDLMQNLGVNISRSLIDSNHRYFIDAGIPLGVWRVKWDWLWTTIPSRGVAYDAQHPLSKLMLSYCTAPLPRRSALIVSELFRAGYSLGEAELESRYWELTQAVKDDGLLELGAKLEYVMPSLATEHTCIYPSAMAG